MQGCPLSPATGHRELQDAASVSIRRLLQRALQKSRLRQFAYTGYESVVTILQGDSTQRWVKDLDVMLGAESAVLILDDTEGVWPRHAANLVHVSAQMGA